MNKYIIINVKNNIKRFINKCNKYNIELYNINYIDKDNIIVKINKKDYKNIKTYNYYSEIEIYRNVGIDYFFNRIDKLKYFILSFILCLVFTYLISNIILRINVIHSNKNIRELVSDELYEYGIKKYSIKKDFNQIEDIKNKILENNKDKLEWISITNIGMTYVVRVEERIIDKPKVENEYCNVVATKESLVTNIFSDKGDILVNVNDLVRKDDILISGNLILNEETKSYTCASGKVMGKVWYNTNITIKRDYLKKEYTGKKRYNFIINHKILKNNKYSKFDKKYIINNRFIKIYKEIEYKEKRYKYNELDSINKALLEIDNKFKNKLNNNGKVLDKKILNKNINNKEINLNVFVITEENIGKQIELNKDEIINTEDDIS